MYASRKRMQVSFAGRLSRGCMRLKRSAFVLEDEDDENEAHYTLGSRHKPGVSGIVLKLPDALWTGHNIQII